VVIIESEEVGLAMKSAGAEKVGVESSEVRHFCLGRHRWGSAEKWGLSTQRPLFQTTDGIVCTLSGHDWQLEKVQKITHSN